MLKSAFGHPVGGIRGQRLIGTIGKHNTSEAEKGGAAGNRTKIVGVTDAVED